MQSLNINEKVTSFSQSFSQTFGEPNSDVVSDHAIGIMSESAREFLNENVNGALLLNELNKSVTDSANESSDEMMADHADQANLATPQWLIDQYEQQYAMQNATKNYVCAPAQSLEALYVEQFRKMSRREDVLKEVPIAEGNRFDVSSQLRLPDEEAHSLDELVIAFRTKKLQRVAALRKNQTVCEESFRAQCRYAVRWLRSYVTTRVRDTYAEFRFALKQLTLYSS